MEIIPVRQEYIFSIMNHTMRAIAEHRENDRKLKYYFDQKLVAEKIIPGGDYYTDDDCIREVIDDYKKNNTGVYADIFNRHIDKVFLTSKTLDAYIVNNGIKIKAKVISVKDYYEMELSTEDGENEFKGRFKALDFSEVLEKMRLFTYTLEGVSHELAQNISVLTNDKIEEVIQWQ